MLKKLNIFILIGLLVIPGVAEAATFTYGYFGTTSQTPNFLMANGQDNTQYWTDISVGGGSGQVIWYGVGSPSPVLGTSSTPGTVSAPAGAVAFGLKSLDGSEVYALIGHTTNPNATTVYFTGQSNSQSSGVTVETDFNQFFNVPGWSQYMGKINDILAAIPPPPNWNNVAVIFRDTIAPQIKSDLQDVLGNAPDLPSEPSVSSDLNYSGVTPPSGYDNAPGLDSSGFSSDDIKNQAPTIVQRDDPTGGFTINNPLDSLPSQSEFEQNIPSDPTNPAPPDPTEPDNVAPTPTEPDNTAPTPTDPDNPAPTPDTSTSGFDTAPLPSDSTNTAPIPGDSSGTTAPIPAPDGSTAPLPSNDSSTAPLPSQ